MNETLISEENQEEKKEEEAISLAEFLESTPPSKNTLIHDLARWEPGKCTLNAPQIQLHCSNDNCNGTRFFRSSTSNSLIDADSSNVFLLYYCANCRARYKTFSLRATRSSYPSTIGLCFKYGESPAYGPPTPARLIKLIGPDRELFLQGRRCENQGLGIGAFAYYRRVVENQKSRILEEIIKVAKKLDTPEDKINVLETAKAEDRFSQAMANVKDVMPQALLINGYNPLTLLHKALSKGIHEKTDEECFNDAQSIRVILGELSDRLTQALKDEAEINHAISNLMKKESK